MGMPENPVLAGQVGTNPARQDFQKQYRCSHHARQHDIFADIQPGPVGAFRQHQPQPGSADAKADGQHHQNLQKRHRRRADIGRYMSGPDIVHPSQAAMASGTRNISHTNPAF